MKKIIKYFSRLCLILLVFYFLQIPDALTQPMQPTLYVVNISGTIDHGLAALVRRSVRNAKPEDVLLFRIDTFGGLVDAATIIKDAIIASPAKTIAFVEKRAWSAGALIAISNQRIVMAPGSSMGAAEPRPADEKTISALRAEFESTAEARNRNPKVAGAMVDKSIAIENLVKEGEILTLTAEQAKEHGYADYLIATLDLLITELKLNEHVYKELTITWSEIVTRWLTEPTILSLLLSFGVLGIYFELMSPGWGIPGTFGIISLFLFYSGRYLAGLAGFEHLLLILGGLVLIFIEMHTPGFGVAGITGIAALSSGMVLALGGLPNLSYSLIIVSMTILIMFIILAIYLPRSRIWKSLGLLKTEKVEEGYIAPSDLKWLLGKEGITLSLLRPTGNALIEGERINVQTEGEFIPANTPIKVVLVEGIKVVVNKNLLS
ncbi:MAG: hypothetical protein DDT40_00353 [candidate division WS2 bacterium]|nr:hypothetical protein [Candidatus Psychracetigena formicireducens]